MKPAPPAHDKGIFDALALAGMLDAPGDWIFVLGTVLALGAALSAFVYDRRRHPPIPERGIDPLPERPEYSEPGLVPGPIPAPAVAQRRLREIEYVVFDTETTGLKPHHGDEIVQLSAVRIRNGEIAADETFDRLINPGRKIPKQSTQFHGITDDMVRDCPAIVAVLPDFRAFLGDAVLVAHNIAFDLAFLHLHETAAGVRFDGPILDTMLLSAVLNRHFDDHSLDHLAARLGISIEGRHTALGDALITARILTAMWQPMTERGINTLGEAVRASGVATQVRLRKARFTHGGHGF